MRKILAAAALALAAPVQAQERPVSAYEICLGAVQSRYIGETEKNLRRAFGVAEETDVALSFDEADALFGRRSDVRDSHDRYANQETSDLLTRIERFHSVERVTSNNRRALIAGFDRRARNAGVVVIETESGVRVFEFAGANRARALEYAARAAEC